MDPYLGILLINNKQLLIQATSWVKLQSIILRENAYRQRQHSLWFHLYNILKMKKKITDMENRIVVSRNYGGVGAKGEWAWLLKDYMRDPVGDGNGQCPNCITLNVLIVIPYWSFMVWMYHNLFGYWRKLSKVYTVYYSLHLHVNL